MVRVDHGIERNMYSDDPTCEGNVSMLPLERSGQGLVSL